jgi:hypothetical protein
LLGRQPGGKLIVGIVSAIYAVYHSSGDIEINGCPFPWFPS